MIIIRVDRQIRRFKQTHCNIKQKHEQLYEQKERITQDV